MLILLSPDTGTNSSFGFSENLHLFRTEENAGNFSTRYSMIFSLSRDFFFG